MAMTTDEQIQAERAKYTPAFGYPDMPSYWGLEDWKLFKTTDNDDVRRLLIEKAASSRSAHCASKY